MLDQTKNYYYLPNALYSTNYNFTITTINAKCDIDNEAVEIMTKTESAGTNTVYAHKLLHSKYMNSSNILYKI